MDGSSVSAGMEKLCERPGCSDPASVGYGMIPDIQVFWLEARATAEETGVGMLCRRHAEAMVVPRGWTLDDRRDPDLHLFKPPATTKRPRSRTRRKTVRVEAAEQLRLGDDQSADATANEDGDVDTDSWTPSFDADDDLDGLLSAKSPLLSRAFRGDGRPRPS